MPTLDALPQAKASQREQARITLRDPRRLYETTRQNGDAGSACGGARTVVGASEEGPLARRAPREVSRRRPNRRGGGSSWTPPTSLVQGSKVDGVDLEQ